MGSADTGDDVCPDAVPEPKTGRPVPVLTGRLEQHITADVVYAAWQYFLATGNTAFREHRLAPLAVETARFWASRAEFDAPKGRHVIRNVIGPDEYRVGVDNNVFTNYMAAWNLALAADEVDRLRSVHARSRLFRQLSVARDEPARWRAIAASLYLPVGAGGRSARIDLEDTMGNTGAGMHAAALGGIWQAVIRGFLGLRQDGPTPTVCPKLPTAWKSVATQVRHRGLWYRIEADAAGARVTPLGQPAEG